MPVDGHINTTVVAYVGIFCKCRHHFCIVIVVRLYVSVIEWHVRNSCRMCACCCFVTRNVITTKLFAYMNAIFICIIYMECMVKTLQIINYFIFFLSSTKIFACAH